jgi:hypothetical protein
MDKKTIILVISIFALIVAGMFIFAYLKKGETTTMPVAETPEETFPYAGITRIDAKHFYIDGVHTFVGELTLPTPCDLLEVDSQIMESFPEQVRLDFNVINNSEVCAQVMTTQRFMVSATASSEAVVFAYLMGKEVVLNLIPAAAGETPDEFELYIKG